MHLRELIGYIGSLLSSITFIPQVWQAWKTKSVGDLSLPMMLIVLTSTIVWIVYATFSPVYWPVVICNGIIFVLALLLIYFKFSFSSKNKYKS